MEKIILFTRLGTWIAVLSLGLVLAIPPVTAQKNAPDSDTFSFSELIEMGDQARNEGQLQLAKQYYHKAEAKIGEASPSESRATNNVYDSWVVQSKLGSIAKLQGDYMVAKQHYDQGFVMAKQMQSRDPGNIKAQRNLSIALSKMGVIARLMGDETQSRDYFFQGFEIARKVYQSRPENVNYARDLYSWKIKIGDIARSEKELNQALQYYQDAVDIIVDLLSRQSVDMTQTLRQQYKYDQSVGNMRIADLLRMRKQYTQALAGYEQVRATLQELLQANPDQREWWGQLGVVLGKKGYVAALQHNYTLAAYHYQQALDIHRSVCAVDSTNRRCVQEIEKTGRWISELP